MDDLTSLPPQFAAIRQRILDAEAKGLIVPEIQLDVPEGETPAETVARMKRMAGFLPAPILFGMPVVIDPTMPDDEMEIRSGASSVRLINIGKDAE